MTRSADGNLMRNRLLLIALLWVQFATKHRLVRLRLHPLGTDPCDAVNAFGILLVLLATGAWLALLLGWYRRRPACRRLYELRSETAIACSILMILIAEAIALAKDLPSWTDVIPPRQLIRLLSPLAILALLNLWAVLAAQRPGKFRSSPWSRIALLALASAAAIAICPEWLDRFGSPLAHFLTVAVGAAALLVPLRGMLPWLVPTEGQEEAFGSAGEWCLLATGVLCFCLALLADAHKGSTVVHLLHLPVVLGVIGDLLITGSLAGGLLGAGRKALGERTTTAAA